MAAAQYAPTAAEHLHGYTGLLNVSEQPHWTVFLSDVALPSATTDALLKQLELISTRPLFLRIDSGFDAVTRDLERAGVDYRTEYLSLQGIVRKPHNLSCLHKLFRMLVRGDLARLELPPAKVDWRPEFVEHLMRVVADSNYIQQDRIANTFFSLLAKDDPYRVSIRSSNTVLEISDTAPWFQLAGRLVDGENRTLPGGEVAYTGDHLDGTFVIDGAILPTAEGPAAVNDAVYLARLCGELRTRPVCLVVRSGRVIDVGGDGRLARKIRSFIEKDERYSYITEVGVSFNGACREFVYDWPAASNEARPGVHLAIGGDPDRRDTTKDDKPPLVHIDLMAANCEVFVNDERFLRASS